MRENGISNTPIIAFSELLEEIPAGICRFSTDENLTILEANEQFYSLFGYAKETALRDGFRSIYFLLDKKEKLRVRTHIDLLRSGKLPARGEFELSIKHPNGANVVVLTHYHSRGVPCKWITVNVIDITNRKRTQEELRIREQRYRLALNQSGKVFFFFEAAKRTMQLPEELAKKFGLPTEVDDMPNNPLALSLVEPESIETYKNFYHRIIAGEKSGDALISCHMRAEPEKTLWYKIAFTSVFDRNHNPASTIITYEEYTKRYRSDIEEKWQQANISSTANGDFYLAIEYDLTRGIRQNAIGDMSWMLAKGGLEYDVMFLPVKLGIISPHDAESYRIFLDRERLLAQFAAGVTEDNLECRAIQRRGEEPRWIRLTVRMIRDPYTDHVLSQTLYRDIDTEKCEQLLIERSMEELQQKLEASRVKAMINQMQPHFLYNALSAIRTIIRRDPNKAYNLLYDFTVHLRSSIKAISSDDPIPFTDELKNIKAYLNIEKMRLGDSLHITYEIGCETFLVVPLSIQPLAENAARHGVYGKGEQGGTITVRSYETADAYVVEVEDDGVGFEVENALRKNENSYGLKNLMFRLETLMHARVDIHSTVGQGTLICVSFPKEGENT